MGYISFNAQQVQGNFIPNIPNDVFLKNIFPHFYPLPPYFGALPYAEGNKYELINKDWAQIQPSISDLFYYYHIVNGQLFYTNFHIYCYTDIFFENALSAGKELYFQINLANFNFIKKVSNNMLPLVQNSKNQVVLNPEYTSKQVIEKKIYYWFFFKCLLECNFDEWLSCYELALKYAREDKRDLKLISDRYEWDLIEYMNQNPQHISKDFLAKFDQVKNVFNILKTEDLQPKKMISSNLWDIFNYIMNQQKCGTYFYYEYFKTICGDLGILHCKESIQDDIILSHPNLIECMLPDIEKIIKKNDLSDDDVKTLYYYLLLLEKWKNNKSMILPVNIVLILNNRLEEMFYNAMRNEEVLWFRNSIMTTLFRSEVLFKTRSQSFYDKFLSVKRIIVFSYGYVKAIFLKAIFWGLLGYFITYECYLKSIVYKCYLKSAVRGFLLGFFLFVPLIYLMEAFRLSYYLFNMRFFNN